MAIKKYTANADNTLTNAFKFNLSTRATGSNLGASDVLEVFHIYGQATTSSAENARVVVQFPVGDISSDRTNGTIPASGSVDFILRLYNAKHGQTLPKNYSMHISAVKTAWEEGEGLDMEGYTDLTYDQTGSNWTNRAGSTAWVKTGGDYFVDASSSFTASFVSGEEDIEVNITTLVEQWMNSAGNVLGSKTNNGVLIKLKGDAEEAVKSYYTKKFFSRSSQYFYKRPTIEARWDSTKKDHRGRFYFSSSVAPGSDNLQTLYLYNVVNGRLRNIPGVKPVSGGTLMVSLYSGSHGPTGGKLKLNKGGGVVTTGHTNATGGFVETGIYSCSLAFTGATTKRGDTFLETLYDVWHNGTVGAGGTEFATGTITPYRFKTSFYNPNKTYVMSITNLKNTYSTKEVGARFRLFTREDDWNPNIYTVASTDANGEILDDVYYKVVRITDGLEIIPFATGAATPQDVGTNASYTRLSYDTSGSYFDLDMSMFEPGYAYGLQFMYYYNDSYREQPEIFKFRVE